MNTTLRQDALFETFNDIQKLIFEAAHTFIKMYGCKGDYQIWLDELVAEANWLFICAYDKFDNSQSNFSTWVYRIIWKGLMNYCHSKSVPTVQATEILRVLSDINRFKTIDILIDASQDAFYVISLVLYSPNTLANISADYGRGDKPRNIRAAVRRFLLTTGWTVKRVKETFNEIQKLLE